MSQYIDSPSISRSRSIRTFSWRSVAVKMYFDNFPFQGWITQSWIVRYLVFVISENKWSSIQSGTSIPTVKANWLTSIRALRSRNRPLQLTQETISTLVILFPGCWWGTEMALNRAVTRPGSFGAHHAFFIQRRPLLAPVLDESHLEHRNSPMRAVEVSVFVLTFWREFHVLNIPSHAYGASIDLNGKDSSCSSKLPGAPLLVRPTS